MGKNDVGGDIHSQGGDTGNLATYALLAKAGIQQRCLSTSSPFQCCDANVDQLIAWPGQLVEPTRYPTTAECPNLTGTAAY